jgi:hypothetical protein
MRTRLLIFIFLLASGLINAQEVIRTLVISEVRLDDARHTYVEIANVGTTTLNLAQFELGLVGPWDTPIDILDINKWFNVPAASWLMLPDKDLAPNKTFTLAAFWDWNEEQWVKDHTKGMQVSGKQEFRTIADMQLHAKESPTNDPTDSISSNAGILLIYGGRDCLYLRHHVSATDSVVIDQVGGIFDEADGTSKDGAHNVAGFTNATNLSTLVRKFSVKTGNVDFESARGLDLTDSEWIPIPFQFGHWEPFRSLFWTAGNHGDYNLDKATLTSKTVDINWETSTLTVPWGVRRDDSLMFQFDHKPGLAWHFNYLASHQDSAFYSIRTGDMMTIYACGNELDRIDFQIKVSPPKTDANIVIPKKIPDILTGFYSMYPPTWIVTDKIPAMDSIKALPFGIRSDTLLKYLEKAPKASWEFEWLSGTKRTDLKTGDILKVTAESGAIKRYYIKIDPILKSHNANLASITWPDIPEFYKDLYGWVKDTIPNFVYSKYNFKVMVPFDVDGIPALVAKTQDVNAKIEVSRARNLAGSPADRTVSFKTTAEDDTSTLVYNVLLEKEKDDTNIQSWEGEPFVSQLIFWEQWSNGFVEIANPGNQPLDLSNYMMFFGWSTDPAAAVQSYAATTDYLSRYCKYIPGYKWQSETEWAVNPGIAIEDLNVNPIVEPGDVFVLGDIRASGQSGYPWFASEQCDIDFANNPWGEATSADGSAAKQWTGATFFLFKILNDSVKLGLKPANDPEDFQLIETFGDGTGSAWVIGGVAADMIYGWSRKPEFYSGKTGLGESFGTDETSSEWIMRNRDWYSAHGVNWPNDILLVADGLGSHFMNEVSIFMSIVTSGMYKVSVGYSMDEEIIGLAPGTTVNVFLSNIAKVNEGQILTVVSGVSGDTLTDTNILVNNDRLLVVSADSTNTTSYKLTQGGLSNDALLTSTTYTVAVTGITGTITGFDYSETVRNIVDAVVAPAGASLNVIYSDNSYVPLVMLNFDTLYSDVLVNEAIFLEVIAEDNSTKIVYQLKPDVMNSGAFVTSNIYDVNQETSLITLVPENTTIFGLLKYLIPAPGATLKVIDKLGFVRTIGPVAKDDQIVATSEDGLTEKIYDLQLLNLEYNFNLAYVLSDVYRVDQDQLIITGNINTLGSVRSFLENLIPAEKATLKVIDINGTANTGTLAITDKLVVTAGDGVTTVTYSLGDNTGVKNQNSSLITVYPNPSAGIVNVSGLRTGNRFVVTNMLGQQILDRLALQNTEAINLSGQPSGLYFITVKNNDQIVGRYKLIMQ